MGLSELQAANICTRALGQKRIASLNTYDPDVANIQSILVDNKRELLTNGYKFNTDTVTLLVDNVTGKVSVAQSVDQATTYLAYKLPPGTLYDRLTDREGYLWDPLENEYYAQDIPNVEVVVDISNWESLPDSCREYIAYKSAADLVLQVKGPIGEYVIYKQKAYEYLCRFEANFPVSYKTANGINSTLSRYFF